MARLRANTMRRIAIINQKGGVGKTTTTANLGAALAIQGRRVVLVDMDAQANLSLALGIEVPSGEPTSYSVLLGEKGFGECVRATNVPGMSIIPSNIDLSGAEMELASAMGREYLLRDSMREWDADHRKRTGQPAADYVLFDCPPSLGLLSINALAAASEVLITLQTEFLALQGMSKLVEVVQLLKRRLNPELVITGIVPTLYDSRLKLAREVLGEIRTYFKGLVLPHPVRANVKLAETPSFGQTIFEYAPDSNGAVDYMRLAQEILSREARDADLAALPPFDPKAHLPLPPSLEPATPRRMPPPRTARVAPETPKAEAVKVEAPAPTARTSTASAPTTAAPTPQAVPPQPTATNAPTATKTEAKTPPTPTTPAPVTKKASPTSTTKTTKASTPATEASATTTTPTPTTHTMPTMPTPTTETAATTRTPVPVTLKPADVDAPTTPAHATPAKGSSAKSKAKSPSTAKAEPVPSASNAAPSPRTPDVVQPSIESQTPPVAKTPPAARRPASASADVIVPAVAAKKPRETPATPSHETAAPTTPEPERPSKNASKGRAKASSERSPAARPTPPSKATSSPSRSGRSTSPTTSAPEDRARKDEPTTRIVRAHELPPLPPDAFEILSTPLDP